MSSPPPGPSATAEPRLSADVELALLHSPRVARPALATLFAIDAAMADVVATARDPNLGRIKLAWWREQLERLDSHAAPAEPRLRAVAQHLLPAGVSGAEAAELEAGWATLLDAKVEPRLVAERGAKLFELAGRLLGGDDEKLDGAGAVYALVSVGRRGVAELLPDAAAHLRKVGRHRFPRALRSVTGLAQLAARDLKHGAPFELDATGGRAWAMLRHRWTGIVTPGD